MRRYASVTESTVPRYDIVLERTGCDPRWTFQLALTLRGAFYPRQLDATIRDNTAQQPALE